MRSHSSSSSINLDLAYGTGYIRRPKRGSVRSRKGKEIDREKQRESKKERDSNRPATDAEILAVGAGLAKLARDQNKLDLKSSRNGKRAELVAVKETTSRRGYAPSGDPGPSKISHGSDTLDEEGWESASDNESHSSVDSRLAFGADSGGWFSWGRPRPPPQSRKSSVVDPRNFGPANSLHGIVTEPVGFSEVEYDPSTDFAQGNPFPVSLVQTPPSGSQTSLQRVYPVATSDPSRFEAARSSVVSGSEPFVSSRPGALPLQQPQPIAPVSQSIYEPTYPAPSESGLSKKSSSSHGRSKSLAEAALAGVAVAAAGAAIASERRDERSDRRRDSDRDDRMKRRDSERESKDDRRREKRQSPDRDERRERRREKERRKDPIDGPGSEKKRENRYDASRYDDQDRRESYQEKREEREDSHYDDAYYKAASSSARVPVDPFQYQVDDDAFETPKSVSPVPRRAPPSPTVVTVDREPDFSRFSSIRVQPKDYSDVDDHEESGRGRDPRENDTHDPDSKSQGTERAAVAAAAIGAAIAASSAEKARRANERRSDRRNEYDSRDSERREKEPAEESQSKSKPERDPIQEEADRAYREIVMARKIASQVIRSRSPSPNRSVVRKYEEDKEEEEEIVRIVTPPGMEEEKEKKKGPYDAPNADFKLDLVLEDPRHLRNGIVPRIDFDTDGPSLKFDPDASKPRPFLNLVLPTPTPSPAPEKQDSRSESRKAVSSTEKEDPASNTSVVAAEPMDDVTSPTSSTVTKGVTWGETETKHYEVESPHEHREEFVSTAEVQSLAKEVEQPKPSRPNKRSGWGAVVAGITGAGIGATVASANEASTPRRSKDTENEKDEHASTVTEIQSNDLDQFAATPTQIPGAFNDDLDFTATVAAGLQDTGFDPNIVINDPSFRRRESPPGSNEPHRKDTGDATQYEESYTSRDLVEEPDSYVETQKLSRKEQRKRDKAAQRQGSQPEEMGEAEKPIVASELVEEPESYSGDSRKSKSKKSKRESSTFEEAEEMPRQSRRISIPVDAFEDLRNGEDEWEDPKKSKKKSKRDSESYDSPSRSAPSEAASEFDTSSSKKSKSKSKRKSGSYDPDPDPTEVSLPPSTTSEVSRDGDDAESRRSKKYSSRDDEYRGESQSVVSADDPRYDEPRKSKKKSSRSSTKDEFEDSRSVASAPLDDDFEYSKSRKKDKRSSGGGGFFGLFGSKSEVDAEEQSRNGSKDDADETKKKGKKSKRDSIQDSVNSEPLKDLPRTSSNGEGRSNGSHSIDDQDKNDSFLDKAGILGAGAGLAGAALAIAAQRHQLSKANLYDSSVALEPTHSERSTSLQQHDGIFDPDIVPRQFRPSIDPQYGDLLPLPPSGPTSPNLESLDHLPELPDSRPDTPDAERFPRDRAMSSARKNLQEGPIKSPSQSAVPLKFIMGNRSVPSSPGLARSSPLQSPVMQREESLAFPRNRSRPTSWDSTKEYKPLYLVETNRRNSVVRPNEPEENLPELPPSQRTSRSSSELDFHDAVSDQGVEQLSSDEQEHFVEPLSIDTAMTFAEATSEILGSQQSTPKAPMRPEDYELMRGDDSDSRSLLPLLPPSSFLLLGSDNVATPVEHGGTEARAIAEPTLSSSIGYFASSPKNHMTNQAWLDHLASGPSIHQQPSPVDPMSKDRSSYLLQSSPLSKKAEDEETFDANLDSATNRLLFLYSDGDSLQSIAEREGDDSFGSTSSNKADVKDEPSPSLSHDISFALSDSQSAAELIGDLSKDNTIIERAGSEGSELVAKTTSTDVDPADEFVLPTSKKNKRDKKKGKYFSRSPASDDVSIIETSGKAQLNDLADAGIDLPEESLKRQSFGKLKKAENRKKAPISTSQDWEPEEEEGVSQSREPPLPETSQDLVDDPSTSDNFAAARSKGKKKKDKKKFRSSFVLDPEDESATPSSAEPEPAQEMTEHVIDPKVMPEVSNRTELESSPDVEETATLEPGTDLKLPELEPKEQDILEEPSTSRDPLPSEVKEENASSVRALDGTSVTESSSREAPEEQVMVEDPVPLEIEKSNKGLEESSCISAIDKDTELMAPPTSEEPEAEEEFLMATSKKSKKKGKKSQTKKDDVTAVETPEPIDTSIDLVDATDVTPPTQDVDDDFKPITQLGSKKSKKPKVWDQEFEPQKDLAGTEDMVPVVPFDKVDTVIPATPETSYYPSASILHSQQRHQDTPTVGKVYFPSALAVLPVAAGAALTVSTLLDKAAKDQDVVEAGQPKEPLSKLKEADENQPPQLKTDPKPVPDGLKAGYDNEQLNLARQLREEFGTKKSKNDKKKRQSLPATPDRDASMSRGMEDVTDDQTRAGSPSIGTSPTTEMAEEKFIEDQPKTIYSEDQVELTRQLNAEFGPGDKKSKKDKKKRQELSRSVTFDDQALDSGVDPAQSLETESLTEFVEAETSTKGDGFAAGYQENQLSLARQLQAEFGSGSKKSKKDKKGKKRQTTSQIPTQESETASDYFREPVESPGIDLLQDDDAIDSLESSTVDKDATRDGLAVGYSTEQLDLARQLKEEFASGSKGSKKEKKDKKRKSLLRNGSEDHSDNTQETQLPPDVDVAPSNSEIVVAAMIEPTAADPETEFTFATKKKGKKSKKRDSLVPDSDDKESEFPSKDNSAMEKEPEPIPVEPASENIPGDFQEEFALVTKKPKKGKKGKKQENFAESDTKDIVEEDIEPVATETIDAAIPTVPEDEFMTTTKKSKKGKKGKRQEGVLESHDKVLELASLPKDQDVQANVAPLPLTEVNEFSVEHLAEEFASVSSKAKKGKKTKKRADTEEDPSSETASKDKDVEPYVELRNEQNPENDLQVLVPENELTAEETKKDEESVTMLDPIAEPTDSLSFEDQVMALHNSDGLRSVDFGAAPMVGPVPTPVEDTPFTNNTSMPAAVEAVESSLEPLECQPEQAEFSQDIDTAIDVVVKENESTREELGESDENRHLPQVPPPHEIPIPPAPSTAKQIDDSLQEIVEKELDSREHTSLPQDMESITRDAAETTLESNTPAMDPQDNRFEEVSFTSKKSKKDKKKRKDLSTVKLEGSETGPSDLGTPPVEVSAAPFPAEVTTKAVEVDDLSLPDQHISPAQATASEPVDEPADEWSSFSTKKSKKEKKKRKSGVSTPVERSITLVEAETSNEKEEIVGSKPESRVADEGVSAATADQNELSTEPVNESVDEWSSFSIKKSKKDKKKRKSGISTTAEASTSLVDEEKPTEKEEFPEPGPEPSSVDNEITTTPSVPEEHSPNEPDVIDEPAAEIFEYPTKKSKKDKKKAKNTGTSTPTVDTMTTDRAVDAVPEIQSDESQPALAALQADTTDSIANQDSSQHLPDQTTEDATKKPKKNKKSKSQAEVSESARTSPFTPEQAGENRPQPVDAPLPESKSELVQSDSQEVTDQVEGKNKFPDQVVDNPEWHLFKHDKRKRQATVDVSTSNESGSARVPPISWADEVEEAEVERQQPVIEDIAKDESLSHIATTTHIDDFSRPAKKGKKGKKKHVESAESSSMSDFARAQLGIGSQMEEPREKEPKSPGLLAAATAVISGAALFLDKPDNRKGEDAGEKTNEPKDVQQAVIGQPVEQTKEVLETPTIDEPPFRALSSTDHGDPSTPQPDLVPESPTEDRGLSFREGPAEQEPITPLNTVKYSHPGSSSLPVVKEESPEATVTRPIYMQELDDVNRDSAFVTDSPIPHHRTFSEDPEHNRDSGVHLRESSPHEKARDPASSTDAALARMSWPAIDEERETVDLHRSQRPTIQQSSQSHEEAHPKELSLPHDVSETGFSQIHNPHQESRPEHHIAGHQHSLSPSQLHSQEPAPKHQRLSSPKYEEDRPTSPRDLHPDNRDDLPSQKERPAQHSGLHRSHAVHVSSKPQEDSIVKQRVQRIESPDSARSQRAPEERYGDLGTSRPKAEKPSSPISSPAASGLGITGTALGFAASRIASQEQRGANTKSPSPSPRSLSNINRLRSSDPRTPVGRPDSVGSNRSLGTPPLRRSERRSGDLRSLSQRSKPDLAKDAELAALTSASTTSVNTANPTANEGRVRSKEMADVYDGFGEGRIGSPRSPTRPHSMRRRQSMQVLDLESRVEQLVAENRQLADARAQAEQALQNTHHSAATLVERDAEIESLKRTLNWLQNEVSRLTEVNDGLTSANATLGSQHNERYSALESQHAQTTRELEEVRESHNNLMAGVDSANELRDSLEDKDREIAQLRADLESAKDRIRDMQREILASKANDGDFLIIRDEDYFDNACQKLCQHVQQWVLRFSKFSDMRACRLTSEINNDKTIDRLDNAILDGSDVDTYLADRVKRRDVFMSMTMTMVWEFVFTRYLFGMDREQRQKLKSLEKLLSEVGPVSAVHHWRATTLTLLSKREAFMQQREQDTLAVVHAIMETLSEILPPPSHLEEQIQEQLVRVIKAAVELSIEMRTQCAEYMMLPPLQPEYDANGDLASKVNFNAALMNERSGDTVSNEELEESGSVVKIVLFPLVVKKGDDSGNGDEEIVVCPAQVLVAKPKKVRVFSPGSVANQSRASMQSTMPAEQQWESVDM